MDEKFKSNVFVSYAHESNAFCEEVKSLCRWLRKKDITVVCDFDYANKPPELGWPAWMAQGIEDAVVVLVIASPQYKVRFEKRNDSKSGKGVAWEGAIITQDLYGTLQQNNKFYPILPNNGNHEDIPKALTPWHNNYRFPDDNENILELILECQNHIPGGDVPPIPTLNKINEEQPIEKTEDLLNVIKLKDFIQQRGHLSNLQRTLFKNAKERIFIMGINALPLLQMMPYHDTDNIPPGTDTCLQKALKDGIQIRILIASENWQPKGVDADLRYKYACAELSKLGKQSMLFPNADFELAEMNHAPNHYIVIVDDEILLGGVFPDCHCKEEPALYFGKGSDFTKSYYKYFVCEWYLSTNDITQLKIQEYEISDNLKKYFKIKGRT